MDNLTRIDANSDTSKYRHIHFNDRSNTEPSENRQSLTHADFIHASDAEVLHRYLSYFELNLPLFLNKNYENFDHEMNVERFKLRSARIHHKDDIELNRLKRIRMAFESIDAQENPSNDEDPIIIIDAFLTYMEHALKKNIFICQYNAAKQLKTNEFVTTMNIVYDDQFNRVLSSFNRICHSPINNNKSEKTSEALALLFHDIFSKDNDPSLTRALALLTENFHLLTIDSNDSTNNRNHPSPFRTNESSTNINREYLIALDILMKSIERSTTECPYRVQIVNNCRFMSDSARELLEEVFHRIRTSNFYEYFIENTNDCVQVCRAILEKIVSNSMSSSMITSIEDKNTYMDFKIDERDFALAMIFFQHLHNMYQRCLNDNERDMIIDYFSAILFGDLYRREISKKTQQIFRLFIQNLNSISCRL